MLAVGVGPGSPRYLTGAAEDAVRGCDVIAGYAHTLGIIRHLVSGQEVVEVTMATQERAYAELAASLGGRTLVVPFTGDACFSESEVVDRLAEVFGAVEVVPGISSVQVAAARAGVPLDRAAVVSMHVTPEIGRQKAEVLAALAAGRCAIVVPRPWPGDPERNFMPSEIAAWLRGRGLDTGRIRARVYERLTAGDEAEFDGTVAGLEGRGFSDMCVAVLGQHEPDSYANYRWQWEGGPAPPAGGAARAGPVCGAPAPAGKI